MSHSVSAPDLPWRKAATWVRAPLQSGSLLSITRGGNGLREEPQEEPCLPERADPVFEIPVVPAPVGMEPPARRPETVEEPILDWVPKAEEMEPEEPEEPFDPEKIEPIAVLVTPSGKPSLDVGWWVVVGLVVLAIGYGLSARPWESRGVMAPVERVATVAPEQALPPVTTTIEPTVEEPAAKVDDSPKPAEPMPVEEKPAPDAVAEAPPSPQEEARSSMPHAEAAAPVVEPSAVEAAPVVEPSSVRVEEVQPKRSARPREVKKAGKAVVARKKSGVRAASVAPSQTRKPVAKAPVPRKKARPPVAVSQPAAVTQGGVEEKRAGAGEEAIHFVVSYGCFSNEREVARRRERIQSRGWPSLTSQYHIDQTAMTCVFGGPFVNPREADAASGLFEEKGCMQIPKSPLQAP